MSSQVQLVLAALLILQIKHFVADFVLQTPYQFLNKGIYGHPGGIIHAGIHAIGSLLAFFVITPSLRLGLAIFVCELVVHYHIDWLKEGTVKRQQWVFPQAEFWWTFGADQVLHQLTYLAMAGALAWGAGL
ncbi:MAG: DUF3307 domain-containing protein [Bradyrhizobiaceae bacterium]|nr:DUF3307 domain-containing protein [Bradyrhizobiaceae bacterium]